MELLERIQNNTARVGVIGLGYVGLPLLRAFFAAGFPVIGFDVDPRKIESLRAGRNYLKHLGEGFVREMAAAPRDRFDATADMSRLGEADAVISCVPTPLGRHLEPDLSYVEQDGGRHRQDAPPGAARRAGVQHLPAHHPRGDAPATSRRPGLKCGRDFFLAYSPEREDPGRKDHNTQTIPKLVGGIDAESGELADGPVPPGDQAGHPGLAAPRWPRRPRSWRTSTGR